MRHGDYHQLADTPSAYQPFPLTAAGEAQAATGAAELQSLLAAHSLALCPEIDSSTLLRAWQTAGIFAGKLSATGGPADIASFDALAERCVGSVANLSAARIAQIVAADPRYEPLPGGWKSASHFRLPFPGAESLMEAGERVALHIRERMDALAAAPRTDTLKLFVGHGAAFRHAAHLLGVLNFDDIPALSMHHGRPVLLERLARGRWQHLDGEWKHRAGHSYTD